jgi:hypothetical protein
MLAIVQRGHLATQQGHRLDLSIFLRADDLFGLLGGALSQTSGDLEPIDGAACDDFIGERGGEILHRPETLDEIVHHSAASAMNICRSAGVRRPRPRRS